MGKTVFISDTHFLARHFSRDRSRLFRDFLNRYVDGEVDALYVLGDAFDPLLGDWSRLRGERKLVRALNETGEKLNKGGMKGFIMLPGNHDIDLSRPEYRFGAFFPHLELHAPELRYVVLRESVGKATTPKVAVRTLASAEEPVIYGYPVNMAHGYEDDPYFSGNPRRYNFLIRLGRDLEGVIGAGHSVAGFWDELNGRFGDLAGKLGGYQLRPGGKDEALLLAARDIAMYRAGPGGVARREKPLGLVLKGHSHRQKIELLYDEVLRREGPLGSVYANTGTWTRTGRYAGSDFTVLHNDGLVENYKWDGEPRLQHAARIDPSLA